MSVEKKESRWWKYLCLFVIRGLWEMLKYLGEGEKIKS